MSQGFLERRFTKLTSKKCNKLYPEIFNLYAKYIYIIFSINPLSKFIKCILVKYIFYGSRDWLNLISFKPTLYIVFEF